MPLLHTDRKLLDGFRRGDREALTRVYQAYAERVLEELCRGIWVRSPEGPVRLNLSALDVDAVIQETFLRAFAPAARQSYDGLRPYWPWLLTIARSAAIDLLRSEGKLARGAVSLDQLAEVVAQEGTDPEALALSKEVGDLVRGFLAQLAERERRFVHLRYVEGFSQQQAGAAIGQSRQEARTFEAKLRKRLVSHLRAEGWLDGRLRTVSAHAFRAAALLNLFLLVSR